MILEPSVLTIEPGIRPGQYKFSIDGVDVTRKVKTGIMTFYYGELDDDQKQCRLQIEADLELPDRYQMIVHREQTNGSNRRSDT